MTKVTFLWQPHNPTFSQTSSMGRVQQKNKISIKYFSINFGVFAVDSPLLHRDNPSLDCGGPQPHYDTLTTSHSSQRVHDIQVVPK
jgi:hypothetical protein